MEKISINYRNFITKTNADDHLLFTVQISVIYFDT